MTYDQLPSDWPTWAIIIFLLISTFRGSLVKILPGAAQDYLKDLSTRRAARNRHQQELEEVTLSAELQSQAADQLREARNQEKLTDLINTQQNFIQNIVVIEIKSLAQSLESLEHKVHVACAELSEKIERTRRATIRQGDITAALFSNLRDDDKRGELFLKTVDELGDYIEGIDKEDYQ